VTATFAEVCDEQGLSCPSLNSQMACMVRLPNAHLHPQDPVFDLMYVLTVMHAKKVQSK
jgi:hypothetical protein